jgi:hypothetical protein
MVFAEVQQPELIGTMRTLVKQLRSWQRREWLFRLAWGAARWLTLVVVVLTAACFTDWYIDRYADTPFPIRLMMTAGQLGLFAAAGYWLLIRLQIPSLDALAGRAEEEVPEFDHRLVTALQLNRPTAKTAGMSPQLIREVTAEAEAMSARHRLASLADRSRIHQAQGMVMVDLHVTLAEALTRMRALAFSSGTSLLDVADRVIAGTLTADMWESDDTTPDGSSP